MHIGIVNAILLSYLVFVDGGLNPFLSVIVLLCFFCGTGGLKLFLSVIVLFCFLFEIGGMNLFLSVSMLGCFPYVNFVSTTKVSFERYLQNIKRKSNSMNWFDLFGLLIGNTSKIEDILEVDLQGKIPSTLEVRLNAVLRVIIREMMTDEWMMLGYSYYMGSSRIEDILKVDLQGTIQNMKSTLKLFGLGCLFFWIVWKALSKM